MKRGALTVMLALGLGMATADARVTQDIQLAPDANAKIALSSCFDVLPVDGFAPVDIIINNHSGQPRRWTFAFDIPGFGFSNSGQMRSTFSITVEDNSTRTIPVMVPVESAAAQYGPQLMRVTVSGYGANGSSQVFGVRSASGRTLTLFVAISNSLGTSIWSSLASQLQSTGRDLNGSTFKPEELPEDWRGLTGVTALWISEDEWTGLSSGQRQAIETWVHTGGQLTLCGASGVPQEFRYPGFGTVQTHPSKLDPGKIKAIITTLQRPFDAVQVPHLDGSAMVQPNIPLLGSFMGLFALVVGPVNIYVLARKHRQRLLWTTPLLSLGASGLLMLVIVMQDGAGGHGRRSAVVYLFPQRHEAAIIQEQTSRTGLLLKAAFQMAEPVWMAPVDISRGQNQARTTQIDGNSYTRDWFVSRAVQAQRIIGTTPTRAEITLLNSGDITSEATPVIVSSFETTLTTLVYTDQQNKSWVARDVHTGQNVALVPLQNPLAEKQLPKGATNGLHRLLQEPGTFWAVATGTPHYIPTLGSIHWTDDPITYLGPVTVPH